MQNKIPASQKNVEISWAFQPFYEFPIHSLKKNIPFNSNIHIGLYTIIPDVYASARYAQTGFPSWCTVFKAPYSCNPFSERSELHSSWRFGLLIRNYNRGTFPIAMPINLLLQVLRGAVVGLEAVDIILVVVRRVTVGYNV